MADLSYLEVLTLTLPCSYCGARPGAWCVTASRVTSRSPGRRATCLHTVRGQAIFQAWRDGHAAGAGLAYLSVAHRLEAAVAGRFWARDMPTDPDGIVRWLKARGAETRG